MLEQQVFATDHTHSPHLPVSSSPLPGRTCLHCLQRQVCFAGQVNTAFLKQYDAIVEHRKPSPRRTHLFRENDDFNYLYIVCSGSVKTYSHSPDGEEKITGFFFPGELIGCSGLGSHRYKDTAETLETTSICAISFRRLEQLFAEVPGLQTAVFEALSLEIQEKQRLLTLLCKRTAEERMADFLVRHSTKLQQRQFSPTDFQLPMSRSDIGNLLNLSMETVSRIFTRLQKMGMLIVEGKSIQITNLAQLRVLTQPH